MGEVGEFRYLGGTLATSGNFEAELHCRIARATGKFAQLRPIWRNKGMSLKSKMLFYRAFIPPALLYGCEAWAITPVQEKKLNAVHMRFLRSLLGVSRWDRWRNERVAFKCGILQVPDLISRARMGWVGHVVRMGEDRLPHNSLFGGLTGGTRGRGRPNQRLGDVYLGDIAAMSARGENSTKEGETRTRGGTRPRTVRSGGRQLTAFGRASRQSWQGSEGPFVLPGSRVQY